MSEFFEETKPDEQIGDILAEIATLLSGPFNERRPGEFTRKEILAKLAEIGADIPRETIRMRIERLVEKGILEKRRCVVDGHNSAVYKLVGKKYE